jgi:hypothetical protein
MLNKGVSYPGQKINEQVLLFLRRHPFTFYFPWGVIIIIMVIGWLITLAFFIANFNGLIFSQQYNALFVVILGCYFMIILMTFLTAWVSFYFDVVIVTRTHLLVIEQNGFFNRKVSEQSLLRIQDVSAKMKGFWQTWLRFGTVFVETAGEAPNFEMNNLPKPHVVANTILKIHDELITSGNYDIDAGEGEGVIRPGRSSNSISSALANEPHILTSKKPEENVYQQTITNETKEKAFEEEMPSKEELTEPELEKPAPKNLENQQNNKNITEPAEKEKKSGELHDGDVIKFE